MQVSSQPLSPKEVVEKIFDDLSIADASLVAEIDELTCAFGRIILVLNEKIADLTKENERLEKKINSLSEGCWVCTRTFNDPRYQNSPRTAHPLHRAAEFDLASMAKTDVLE